MHRIGFYLGPRHEILDLAGPLSAFNLANSLGKRKLYELSVASESGGAVVGSSGLPFETVPFRKLKPDTVIFVGGDIAVMQTPEAIRAATQFASKAVRIASVCTGAFLLAETGHLDGRKATTHWRNARDLQMRHPKIKVEPDNIFVVDGPVWTSAGIVAGIDLALAMIEADHGVALARLVSRYLVVPYRRSGGQSQFSAMSQMEPESDRIRIALGYARAHLKDRLSIQRLADAASLSVRQFSRAFRRETGVTPAKAIERLRVEAARARLQSGSEPVQKIARAVGFGDPEKMRRAFVKIHGQPPQAIRRSLRAELAEG
jgi:transcriptional regulator GlxA family with amidase domain